MSKKIEFYKENKLKMTEIGEIPEEWKVVKIGDCGKVVTGTTPSTKVKDYWNGPYPFVTPTDISGAKYVFKTERRVSQAGIRKGRLIPKNSVLVTCIGSTIGKSALAYERCITNQQINAIICKKGIDPHYVFYAITYKERELRNWAGSAAKPIIKKSLFKKFPISIPRHCDEQQKISSVLSAIDDAIQKTDEIIRKTQELKEGLMQRILTKGIGHTRFKKTEIGEIPEEWEVVKLKDAILDIKSGFACGKRDENGILQLRMDSINPEGWINIEAGVKVPIPKNIEDYLLKPGDILFNNTNSVDLIGKTAIFRGEFTRCTYSNHLTRIRVNHDKALPEWILHILIRKWQLGVFRAICHRHVHQAGINNRDILNLKIPLPRLSEQQKIVEIFRNVDKEVKMERQTKENLEKTKRWFMQNLLTGKIRVKVN